MGEALRATLRLPSEPNQSTGMHSHALACTGMHWHALACNHVHSHALACNHVQSSHLGLELEGAHRKRDDDLLEPLRVPEEERNQRLSEALPGYRMRDAIKDQ